MNISNKFIIAKYIEENKNSIIQKYNENMSIPEIAELYGVAESTIYLKLINWGIKIKKYRAERRRRNERQIRQKRKFSPQLQARIGENTRINDEYIKVYRTVETKDDRFLVRDILSKSEVIK
ncbi:hypothetical protein ES708_32512 [subsurface metagenome]